MTQSKQVKAKNIYSVCGQSMFPALRNGDKVLIESVNPDKIRVRDILVFKKGADYMCHRLVKVDEQYNKICFYLKGDASDQIDIVTRENILGRATGIMRQGKIKNILPVNSFLYVILIKLGYLNVAVLHKIIFALYNQRFIRKFLKNLPYVNIHYELIKNPEFDKNFKSFCNPYSKALYKYSVLYGILAYIGTYPAAKMWILKANAGKIIILGPWVRVWHRARGIGSGLMKYALGQIKELMAGECVYNLIAIDKMSKQTKITIPLADLRKLPVVNFLKKSGFILEKYEEDELIMKYTFK